MHATFFNGNSGIEIKVLPQFSNETKIQFWKEKGGGKIDILFCWLPPPLPLCFQFDGDYLKVPGA